MKIFFFGAVICLATGLSIVYATVSGQYSVNIHFVPPLITGTCNVAQFWNPPNVTCAVCFCMTGSLSRCIPRAGCSPNNTTTNSTSTTPSPNSTTAASLPTQMANHQPTTEQNHVTNKPTATSPTPQPQGPEETTLMPSHTLNFVRRRRRTVD